MAKRKPVSILKKSEAARKKEKIVKTAAVVRPAQTVKADRAVKKAFQAPSTVRRCWQAASIVDRQAAYAVATLLRADEAGSGGASIKSLTMGPAVAAKKATHAVTCETLRMLPVISQAVEAAGLLQAYGQLPAATAFVLCYELLFGEGLRQKGPAERAVFGALPSLRAKVAALQQAAGVDDARELVGATSQRAALQSRPRAARVNTLKMSVAEAHSWLRCPPQGQAGLSGVGGGVSVDDLLPDVLLFPPGTDLHDHPLVRESCLILQCKASCMPAHALKPESGSVVLDACAAPGNKTTHLAAMVGGTGRVLAFDKDPKRLARLKANAAAAGASSCITACCADFLSLPLASAPEFAAVTGVLLDPSCSGSGMALSRMDHLLPSFARDEEAVTHILAAGAATSGVQEQLKGGGSAGLPNPEHLASTSAGGSQQELGGNPSAKVQQNGKPQDRLQRLAAFQEAALRHALTLPALQRLVYSTCSVHEIENEAVVAAVLPEAIKRGFALADPFPAWRRRGLPGSVEGAEKLVRVHPVHDATDGFFLAVFQRVGAL